MITYREASSTDLESICALGNEVNAIHHTAWPQIFAPNGSIERDQAFWAKSIETPGNAAFLAEQAGQIIGFITITLVDETGSLMQTMRYGRLGSVCVTASHQGQGVGRTLLAMAEQWAASHSAVDIRLQVWSFNERAVALYEELGYSIRSHILGKRLS